MTGNWWRLSSRIPCNACGSETKLRSHSGQFRAGYFKGKVKAILDAMSQGQLQPSGELLDPNARERQTPGRVLAEIQILDDISQYNLPGGVTAEVALYTDHWHHVGVMRRVLLRMSSWMNYVFLEH